MGKIDDTAIPMPTYERDKKQFAKTLAKEYKRLHDELLLSLIFNPTEPMVINQVKLMRQISFWAKNLDKQLGKQIDTMIKKSFQGGQAYHLLSIKEAQSWEEASSLISFNVIMKGRVEALFADTYKDILQATAHTEECLKAVVRDTVKKVAQANALRNTNYTDQYKQLVSELSQKGLSKTIQKDGFVGIVDRAGRKWDLKTYSKMVITTKVQQATIEGVLHESKETGYDLAVISDHGAEDACGKWEGIIISMTGATEGYHVYKDVIATNEIWHPNCTHSIHPIRSLEMLHPEDVETHKNKMSTVGDPKQRVYRRKKRKK